MEPSENNLIFLKDIYSFLESYGIKVWLFGGWAEELQNIIQLRPHKDVDLLYIGENFKKVDECIQDHNFQIIKSFPHKRAFLYKGIMVEIFLVQERGTSFETNFFSQYIYKWPRDTFTHSAISGFRVVSNECLAKYREDHAMIEKALSEYRARNSSQI